MSWPWLRDFRLQWSLRTLLLLITLASIPAGVATRWPYEVVEKRRDLLWRQSFPTGFTDKQGNLSSTEERANYRGLFTQYRVRHGKSELVIYNRSERLRLVERHYRNGVLHGSYREFYFDCPRIFVSASLSVVVVCVVSSDRVWRVGFA